jgi:hypothetical protein
MYLYKTDKSREELAASRRTLSQRERAVVLMADGTRTGTELLVLLPCDEGMIEGLMASGYLLSGPRPSGGTALAERRPVAAPPSVAPRRTRVIPRPTAPSVTLAALAVTPADKPSTDNFDGKRSLATTRMFLFDISERMFARRHPDKALWFRDQLREARDRDSMLSVSRDMIAVIEDVAGHERADSLSERIAMLLPLEV